MTFVFYHCSECGALFTQFHQLCPVCKEWTTFQSEKDAEINIQGEQPFPLQVTMR